MIYRLGLFAVLLGLLAACAAPPTTAPVPPTAPSVATAKPAATNAPAPTPAAASTASCATTNAAPPDKFRSDDPKKLEASAKPKLVEFFAFW